MLFFPREILPLIDDSRKRQGPSNGFAILHVGTNLS